MLVFIIMMTFIDLLCVSGTIISTLHTLSVLWMLSTTLRIRYFFVFHFTQEAQRVWVICSRLQNIRQIVELRYEPMPASRIFFNDSKTRVCIFSESRLRKRNHDNRSSFHLPTCYEAISHVWIVLIFGGLL